MVINFGYRLYLDVKYSDLYEILCDNLRSGESYMFNFDNKMKYNIINLKCLSLMPLDSNKNKQIMITDIKDDILVPYDFNVLNISKNE